MPRATAPRRRPPRRIAHRPPRSRTAPARVHRGGVACGPAAVTMPPPRARDGRGGEASERPRRRASAAAGGAEQATGGPSAASEAVARSVSAGSAPGAGTRTRGPPGRAPRRSRRGGRGGPGPTGTSTGDDLPAWRGLRRPRRLDRRQPTRAHGAGGGGRELEAGEPAGEPGRGGQRRVRRGGRRRGRRRTSAARARAPCQRRREPRPPRRPARARAQARTTANRVRRGRGDRPRRRGGRRARGESRPRVSRTPLWSALRRRGVEPVAAGGATRGGARPRAGGGGVGTRPSTPRRPSPRRA